MAVAHSNRRSIRELVAKYRLEPRITDVWVEGPFDKQIVGWFCRLAGLPNVKVLEIASVDVPDALLAKYSFTSGEKQRVVTLARELENELGPIVQATCIADVDCDRLLGKPPSSGSLLFATDYASMEAYLFDEFHLEKYVCLVLGCSAVDLSQLLHEYGIVLQELFLVRAACEALGLMPTWLDFTKCCEFGQGRIVFQRDEFVKRLLEGAGLHGQRERLEAQVAELRPRVQPDIRHQVNGHDFLALLNSERGQVAKRRGLQNERAVRTALLGCLDHGRLSSEKMFMSLKERLGR